MRLALKRVQGTGRDVMFSNYSKLKDYNVNRNQLWNSILQQAISGKLVPQLDSEPEVEQVGPAPAQDEVPFELPAKWKLVKMSDIAESIRYGYTASAATSGNAKFLRITDLKDGEVDWSSVPYCEINDKDLAKLTLRLNDILIARSGSVGKSYVVEKPLDAGCDAVFASYLIRIRLNKDAPVEIGFIKHFLNSPVYWDEINENARGTALKNVNAKQLEGLLIPLPPLEEQRRIVARLAEVLLLVERFGEAQEQLVKLEAEFPSKLKASILQLDSEPEVEQVGPAPQPDEVPFELPPKWKWVQLYAVAEYNPKVDANDDLEVSFVPLEKLSWAYDWEPTFDQTKAWGTVKKGYKQFKDGDVIFAKITPSFHNRKSGLVTKACNGIGCGSTEFCVYRCQEQLLNKFLLWFFKSSYFINFGKRTYKGTAGQLRVNLDVINSMYLPLPPIEEQRRIVAELEEVFAGVEKLGSLMEYA